MLFIYSWNWLDIDQDSINELLPDDDAILLNVVAISEKLLCFLPRWVIMLQT